MDNIWDRQTYKFFKCSHNDLEGNTLLTRCLDANCSDRIILNLLSSGANVNRSGKGGCLPLHLSIGRPTIAVAHDLVLRGADLNALDGKGDTALHCAVQTGDMEALCMLLIYGADVTLTNAGRYTPLMWALDVEKEDMARTLLDYYADFSCTNTSNETVLDIALWYRSDLALDLIRLDADFSRCSNDNAALRAASYECSELFQRIFSKMNSFQLLEGLGPFLINYLAACDFPMSSWVKCLFLLLSSPAAFDLVQDARNFVESTKQYKCSIISEILLFCAFNNAPESDRLGLIYRCLSLGDVVNVSDVRTALQLYGFGKEVEALVYAGDFTQTGVVFEVVYPLPACILSFQEETDQAFICDLFRNIIRSGYIDDAVRALGYFTLSPTTKRILKGLSELCFVGTHEIFCQRLEIAPKVPSLLELSRNQARKHIKQVFNVKKAYQFHDAVKMLNLPRRVKDVLRFKIAIYKRLCPCCDQEL